MAIEIIPHPKPQRPFWASALLVISIVLIMAFAGSYIYLFISAEKVTQLIQEKESSLQYTPEEEALRNEITIQAKKIGDFSKLLAWHRKPGNIFSFLENTCHPNVWFTDFDFDTEEMSATVKGKAATFTALGQQSLILREEEVLKNINLTGISITEDGEIEFTLQLIFSPEFFK